MTPNELFNQCMAIILFVFMTVSLSCYVIQRDKFPISQRFPYVVMFEILCIGTTTVMNCLNYAFPSKIFSTCQGFLLFVQVVNNAASASFVFRIQLLFVKDFSTKLLVQQANADEFSDEISKDLKISRKDGCLFKAMFSLLSFEMQYFGPWMAAFVHTIPIMVAGIVALISLLINPSSTHSGDCLISSADVIPAFCALTQYAYMIVSAIPVFVLFKGMKDPLYLVFEQRMLIVFIAFATISGILFYGQDIFKWIASLEAVGVLGITFFPIVVSFKLQKKKDAKQEISKTQTSSIGEVIEELRLVIETPTLRQLFLKHLEMEYSVENLSFYEACVSLEIMIMHSRNRDEIVEKIIFIRDNFLLTSAISCVNISHPNRVKALGIFGTEQLISAASKETILSTLKDPKEEILKLMATDSFGRFKRSEAYEQQKTSTMKKSGKFSQLKSSWSSVSSAGKLMSSVGNETDLEVMSPLKE
jgi:hypothetical protein